MAVAVAGAGVEFGVSFLSKFFCLSLLSCTVIFECSASFLYLMVEISQKKKRIYGSYERDIFVCFSKLEFLRGIYANP